MLVFILAVTWIAVAGAATLMGLEYYLLPLQERAFSPLAEQFAPTGLWGQGLGIVGTLLIVVGVVGYMARKRLSWLQGAGALRHWLQVHIFLCTLGPYLVLLHTTFKFGGVVSVAFWSMVVVVASGVFGRYVYAHIPKTVQGRFLGVESLRSRIAELAAELRDRTDLAGEELARILEPQVALPSRPPGLAGALFLAVRADASARREERRIRRALRSRDVPRQVREDVVRLTRERHRLHQQALVMHPFQRLFRYWHVVHLPLAILMALILVVHVGVAIAFGYTWIW
ncbi:MAG TPA: hypothetical protein VLA43_13890 [Longimicrobiales bacterium]|nr:hypothetical protein [Longimicrobiales bacterium]